MKVSKSLLFISLASLIFVSGLGQNYSTSLQSFSVLNEGINTCFSRVAQSYTAKIIGDQNSAYLNESFHNLTEECFAESIATFEAMAIAGSDKALGELNTLSKDVHWFHQRLTAKPAPGIINETPEKVLVANLGGRFEKLELKRDSVLEFIDEKRTSIIASTSWVSGLFYFLAGIVPLFFIWNLISFKSEAGARRRIEDDAQELITATTFDRVKAEEVIASALRHTGMNKSANFFDTYRTRIESPILSDSSVTDTAGSVEIAKTDEPGSLNQQMDRIWNAPEKKVEAIKEEKTVEETTAMESVEAENVLTGVIDLLSSKIFTQGIKLDINTEEVDVFANSESLEQVFYHVLMNSIESYDYDDPAKNLSINMRLLGGTLFMDFYDSGRSFDNDFLRVQAGLVPNEDVDPNYLELTICKELISEFGGKISFENVANDDGDLVGRKVQISLRAVPKGKVRSVEKTTKRALLEKLGIAKTPSLDA